MNITEQKIKEIITNDENVRIFKNWSYIFVFSITVSMINLQQVLIDTGILKVALVSKSTLAIINTIVFVPLIPSALVVCTGILLVCIYGVMDTIYFSKEHEDS